MPDVLRSDNREFHTEDAEQAAAFLSELYGSSLQVGGVLIGNRFRYVRAGAGAVRLDEVEIPANFRGSGEIPGLLVILRLRRGRVQRDTGGISERFMAGDTFIRSTPGQASRSEMFNPDIALTALPERLLTDVAHGPDSERGVNFTRLHATSALGRRRWNSADDYARKALADPWSNKQPLLVGGISRLLVATALAVFGNDAPGGSFGPVEVADQHDGHQATLRRAVAFIDSHPDLDITVTDIARAASVTPRSVQLAFQRHLGTTPMAYLRRLRLELARADLVAAAEDETVVTVAARWGFARPSRFAAEYRGVYGEHPYTTLTAEDPS